MTRGGDGRTFLLPCERHLLELLVETGWSTKRLAAVGGLTEGTVKEYLARIRHVLKASSRAELIVMVLQKRIRQLEQDNAQKTRLHAA